MALGGNMDCAYRSIRMIRERDCDFLTVENVQAYSGYCCTSTEAKIALLETMGRAWCVAGGVIDAADILVDCRLFSVIPGKRWTKVPEFMSNGQRTARWFVDEATGEVRVAKSWRAPQTYALTGAAAAFVLSIVKLARQAEMLRTASRATVLEVRA